MVQHLGPVVDDGAFVERLFFEKARIWLLWGQGWIAIEARPGLGFVRMF
jgi:hypothetical protein